MPSPTVLQRARPYALRIGVGASVCGILAVVTAATMLPRIYETQCSLVFPMASDTGGSLGSLSATLGLGGNSANSGDLSLDTYMAVLASERVGIAAVQASGAAKLYHLDDEDKQRQWAKSIVSTTVNPDRTVLVRANVPGTTIVRRSLGELLHRDIGERRDAPYRAMGPAYIHALLDAMEQVSDEIKLDRAKYRRDTLEKQLTTESAKLDRLTAHLVQLQTKLGNPDLEAFAQAVTQQMVQAYQALGQAKVQLAQSQAERSMVQAQIDRQVSQLDSLPADSPLLRSERDAYRTALLEYRKVSQMYGPDNPAVLRAKHELTQAEQLLRGATASVVKGLDSKLMTLDAGNSSLQAGIAKNQAAIDEYQSRLRLLPGDMQALAMAKAQVEAQMSLLASLQKDKVMADSQYIREGHYWSILDEPREAKYRKSPRLARLLLIGLLGGALLGGAGLVAELVRDLVKA